MRASCKSCGPQARASLLGLSVDGGESSLSGSTTSAVQRCELETSLTECMPTEVMTKVNERTSQRVAGSAGLCGRRELLTGMIGPAA